MAEIIAKKDNKLQCFANLKLDNGERVMVSVAQTGVRISKMKWAGMIPAATLWEAKSLTEVYEKSQHPQTKPNTFRINYR